jgi:hypothetical protein
MHCFILGGMASYEKYRDVTVTPDQWPESETAMRGWWSARLAPQMRAGMPAVKEDLALADRAGLDAFAVLLGDRHLPNSQFAPGIKLLAEAAQTTRVKLFPDLWGNFSGLDDAGERLYGQHVKELMDAYPDAFLKRDGRWVISLGCPLGYGRSHDNFVEWSRVKPFFDAWGGPSKLYVILNVTWDLADLTTGWGNAPDAFSQWAPIYSWGDRSPKGPDTLKSFAARYGKAISWPVHTSYFGGRKGCESMSENLGVSTFADMWREAISNRTPLAQIATWNDFSEDHSITESNLRGDSLIDLTRYFSDWYHAGRPPKIAREQVYLFHQRQLVAAKLSDATILAHNDQWHRTPTVDYLNVVTVLKARARLELTDGTNRWSLDAPAGLHEWLVYVPSPKTEMGPNREAFDHHDGTAYPVSTSTRTVTVATAIAAGTPSLTVTRAEKPVATVVSRLPLAGSGKWQDLSMVGTDATF